MEPRGPSHWLTRQRVHQYTRLLLALGAGLFLLATIRGQSGLIGDGVWWGFDFPAFYTASLMAQDGTLANAFDGAAFYELLQRNFPGTDSSFYWLYPPTFAVLILPLAFLPYGAAYLLWCAAGLVAYGLAMRLLAGNREITLAAIAFPAVYLSLYHGQNSLFVAALFAVAARALLKKQDWQAGLWIALILIKPHFGLLIPFVLLAARGWRAFFWSSLFSVAFLCLATAIFGLSYWQAFLEASGQPRAMLEDEAAAAWLSSVFGLARSLGFGLAIAWVLQAVTVLVTLSVCGYSAWKDGLTRLTLALMITGSLLIMPYCRVYDLAVLGVAGVLIIPEIRDWRKYEREALFAAVLLPLFTGPLANATGLSTGALPALIFFVILSRRLLPVFTPGRDMASTGGAAGNRTAGTQSAPHILSRNQESSS